MVTQLYEVSEDGDRLSMMNGSLWLVNPSDIPTVCTWIPMDEIKITKNKIDNMYNYSIKNLGNNIVIKARKDVKKRT